MKTIIVHGEDTPKSYQRLTKFLDTAKTRDWEIIYDEVLATPSLFGKQRLFVIKDYRVLPKNLNKFDGTLVIYNEGNIPVTILNKFKEAKIERFDPPKIIWRFLDKPSVKLLHEVIKKEPIELVFHLFAKRLRKTKYLDELAKIDIDAKTGKADLLLSLDLFIAKHLE